MKDSGAQSLHVLIVGDNPAEAEILVRSLRWAGFEPDWQRVDNEGAYLERLHGALDLVLSDYEMPRFSGLRALELLKQSGREVPFIIVSGAIGEDSAVAAMKAGAADYLLKNRLARLGEAVTHAIAETRLRRERPMGLLHDELDRRVRRRTEELGNANQALRAEIAEHRRTEEALRQAKERTESVLAGMSDVYVIFDLQGRYLYANEAAISSISKTAGVPRDQILGRSLWELFPALAGTELERHYRRTRDERIAVDFEFYYAPREMWWHNRFYPSADGMAVFATDITESKRGMEALRESEARFRELAENIEEVFWVSDPKKIQKLYISPAYEKIWGRTCQSLYDSPDTWLETVYLEDRARVLQALRTKQAQGTYDEEYRIVRPDNSICWIRDRAFPVRNAAGEIYRIAGVAEDITDRKRAEIASVRLAAMVEFSDDAIIGKDLNSIITSWNGGAEKIFGYSASEMVGTSIMRLIPADRQDEEAQILEKIKGGESVKHFETLRRTKDGKLIDVSVTASPIRDATGKVIGVSRVARDITDRKRTVAELWAAQQQLRALVGRLHTVREEEAKRIARELHDDLGQHLTGINMELADLELNLPGATPHQRNQISRMHTIVDHTIEVVQKIASELRLGHLEVFGLTAAIDWELKEFSRRSAIPCRLTRVDEVANLSDAQNTAIFRILQEALTNIVRHAGATQVEISLQTGLDQLTLAVRDNGRGITAAELSGRKAIGLLGMRERAQIVGGDVTITGGPGAGTIVLVRIPLNGTREIPA